MTQSQTQSTEIGRLLDEATETLRWCRQHLSDRKTSEKLRELQITIASLALALDYQMDGETQKAKTALERADWKWSKAQAAYDYDFWRNDH